MVYLTIEVRGGNWHCAGVHMGSAVCVMYDSECAHALTCDLSGVPFLGDLAVYRVFAAPLDDRSPPPCENSLIGGPIG